MCSTHPMSYQAGSYAYINGTNIEVAICRTGAHSAICACREGTKFIPFQKKNKHNIINQLPFRLNQQEIPYELLGENAFVKRNTRISKNFTHLPFQTTPNKTHTEGKLVDHKNNKLVVEQCGDKYKHHMHPSTWAQMHTQHQRVTVLYIHGMKEHAYPVLHVKNNIVTFNTKPTIKAHIAACRTFVSRSHLYSRTARQNPFPFHNESKFLKHTDIRLHTTQRKDNHTLCFVNHNHNKLIWVHDSLITHTPINAKGNDVVEHQEPVHIHGILHAWGIRAENGIAQVKIDQHIYHAETHTLRTPKEESDSLRQRRIEYQCDITQRHQEAAALICF